MSLQQYANLNLIPQTVAPTIQAVPNNIPVASIINQGVQRTPNQNVTVQDLIRMAGGNPDTLYQQKAPMSDRWTPFDVGNKYANMALNFLPNVAHELPELGTGVTYMLSHPKEIGQDIYNWATSDKSVGTKAQDVYNAVIGEGLGLTAEDIKKTATGEQSLGQTVDNMLDQLANNPLQFAASVSMTGAGNVLGKAAKAAQATRVAKSIQAVSDVSATTAKKVASKMIANQEKLDKTIKSNKYTKQDIADTVRFMEDTNAGAIPERLKPLANTLEETYKVLDESGIVPEYTRVPYRDMAITQSFVRSNGGYFADWKRELTPLFERMYEGVADISPEITEGISKGEAFAKINKGLKKYKDLTDDTKLSDLSGNAKNLFEKYLTKDEIGLFEQEGTTLGEIKNYLKDTNIDASTRAKAIFNPNKLTETQKLKIQENLEKMAIDAANGDEIMQKFLLANKQFEEGNLFPVSHGLAPVVKAAGELAADDRKFAGRYSERAYGTASYDDIAEQVLNPREFYNNAIKGYIKDEIAKNILKGEISEGVPLVDSATTKIKYLNRAALEDGSLETALKTASDSIDTFGDNSIPIDRLHFKSLNDQLGSANKAWFGGGLEDTSNLWKQTALVSGGYLGGNLMSGAFNAAINSNINIISDIVNAIGTRGKLIKELGVYRDPKFQRTKFNTEWANRVNKLNRKFGGQWINAADAWLQNLWAETAAHANFRSAGIAPKNRLAYAQNLSGKKLADAINDIRMVSFAQLDKTIIPREMQGFMGTVSPFWRWLDTATQSNLYMLAKHPALQQMVMVNMLGRIGFDKEMQNRLNLRVESDRPLVSYRFDPKTGETKELTADFLPQMTTLKALVEPKSIVRNGMPVVNLLINTAQGRDAYGRPMKRSAKDMFDQIAVNGNRRYRINPETGRPEPFDMQGDEVLATLAKTVLTLPNLANKTLMPLAAGAASAVTGNDIKFYQPYGQSVFGSFTTGQPEQSLGTFIKSGNPLKPRSIGEVVKSLSNVYEMNYYPDEPSPSIINKLNRNRMYQYNRNLRGY